MEYGVFILGLMNEAVPPTLVNMPEADPTGVVKPAGNGLLSVGVVELIVDVDVGAVSVVVAL
jgi:hypothetical protein